VIGNCEQQGFTAFLPIAESVRQQLKESSPIKKMRAAGLVPDEKGGMKV
jgi:hypothetical protein